MVGLARGREAVSERSTPAARLKNPYAVLSRSDLAELGFERRAADAIFRGCPVVSLPGYSRPLIRVSDFAAFLEEHTYRGDRVRPSIRQAGGVR
jgi:hypothetical protein